MRNLLFASILKGNSGCNTSLFKPTTRNFISFSKGTAFNDKNLKNIINIQQNRFYAVKIVKVPPMAESISEGTLKKWTKEIGEFVQQDEEVASVETDKVDIPINAPESGTLVEFFAKEEDTIAVGADLFSYEPGNKPQEDSKSAPNQQQKESKEQTNTTASKPQETKIEKTSAPPPSIPKADSKVKPEPQPSKKAEPSQENNSNLSFDDRQERRVKMNRMRLKIAERLKQSQNTAASLTTFNEVDMSNLMEMRSKFKDGILKKHGIKFGFMSAFVKASAHALQEVSVVNAAIEGEDIVYRDYVDVSVAVATPKGLVTPVIRNCHKMSMIDIEKSIAELGQKAKENKIAIEDLAGGTFTISNGGVFGSMMGTPILNLPQSAILGMHAIKERPVVINGKVEIRPMMYLALTYDHRLIDGREAVTFLVKIKDLIEDPRRFLLDV